MNKVILAIAASTWLLGFLSIQSPDYVLAGHVRIQWTIAIAILFGLILWM